jgi:membrane protein implicated in regulation of membrane protease activity
MEDWWDAMSQLEHVYWMIAMISGILFVVVLVGTFIGGTDVEMDNVDADVSADGGIGFQFLTFKNMVGFFTVFAWAGIASINSGYSNTVTVFISIFCGLVMMVLMAWMFFFMAKQAESGTLQIKNAIGQIGEVYTTVGKDRSSMGKIQIKVQGSLRELEAITDEDVDLTQGNVVKVLEVVSGELLLIEKLKK